MPLSFYRANAKNTGASCSFSFNSKEEAVFVSLKRQVSYDLKKRIGSFWDGERFLVKFSVSEVGDLIRCIEQNKDFVAFHKSAKFSSQIHFKTLIKDDAEGQPYQKGFFMSVFKNQDENKTSILIGFNLAEAVVIREYLKFSLHHIFSAIYSADKKRAEQRAKEKSEEEQAGPEPEPESVKQPVKAEPKKVPVIHKTESFVVPEVDPFELSDAEPVAAVDDDVF